MSFYVTSVVASMIVGGVVGAVAANGAVNEFIANGILFGFTGPTGDIGPTGIVLFCI